MVVYSVPSSHVGSAAVGRNSRGNRRVMSRQPNAFISRPCLLPLSVCLSLHSPPSPPLEHQDYEDVVDREDDGCEDGEGVDGHERRVARRDERHHLRGDQADFHQHLTGIRLAPNRRFGRRKRKRRTVVKVVLRHDIHARESE